MNAAHESARVLRSQAAAVRALHRAEPAAIGGGEVCATCRGDGKGWPCETIKALDGPSGSLSPAPKDFQTPDVPAEALAMRYELSCMVCSPNPHFHLAPFESNAARNAWADAHQVATGHEDFRFANTPVSVGPAEAAEPATALPQRDDQVATWIKAARDRENPDGTAWDLARWNVLDDLLEDYRLHSDTGTPLDQPICDGANCDACREAGEQAGNPS